MRHGRDHDERLQKAGEGRHSNTPPDAEALPEPPSSGQGSEVAPTPQAAERERVRHALEEEAGRHPAGIGGRIRAELDEDLDDEELEEAAAEADREVAGHESSQNTGGAPGR
jgi:hypothetical protein